MAYATLSRLCLAWIRSMGFDEKSDKPMMRACSAAPAGVTL